MQRRRLHQIVVVSQQHDYLPCPRLPKDKNSRSWLWPALPTVEPLARSRLPSECTVPPRGSLRPGFSDAGVEECLQFRNVAHARAILSRDLLRATPRHCKIRKFVARWACHDQRGVFELRTVKREYILNHEFATFRPLMSEFFTHVHDVKSNHTIPFSSGTDSPSMKPGEQFNTQRLQRFRPRVLSDS